MGLCLEIKDLCCWYFCLETWNLHQFYKKKLFWKNCWEFLNFQILHKTFDTLRFAQNLDFKTGSARILIREWVSKLALNVSGNIWNLHHNVYRRIFLNLHLFYFENNYFLKLKVNTWLKVYKISSFTKNLNFCLFVIPVTKKTVCSYFSDYVSGKLIFILSKQRF